MTNPYVLVAQHRSQAEQQQQAHSQGHEVQQQQSTQDQIQAGSEKKSNDRVMQLKAHSFKFGLTNNIADYIQLGKLGEGGFGDVILAMSQTGEKLVLKRVKKSLATDTLVANGMKCTDHTHTS
jgi:hypothetical protein